MATENINQNAAKKTANPIIGVRFPPEDADVIRQAARHQSISISAFIRQSAVNAARAINGMTAS